jgi:UDP-N-acetylglucosamine 4-epimerase
VYFRLRDDLIATPRTWLITGVAGFIGSSLLEQLLDLGQRVVGLDNLCTGSRDNLDDVLDGRENAAFRFIEGDIRSRKDCREACEGVDVVLHQAALPSVPMSIEDPLSSHSVNVGGFLSVLSAAREARVSRVVYASSSAVYGEASLVPVSEDHAGAVLSPYAADKLTNEIYASVWRSSTVCRLLDFAISMFLVAGRIPMAPTPPSSRGGSRHCCAAGRATSMATARRRATSATCRTSFKPTYSPQ